MSGCKHEHEAEVGRLREGQSVMLDDLAALLRALGLGDHARPETPHHVMLSAIAEVERLRAEPLRLLAQLERLRTELAQERVCHDCREFRAMKQAEVERLRAAHTEAREAWLKQGTELVHWQQRAQKQDAALQQAEAVIEQAKARLAKVVEAWRRCGG